jgi:hypothetical protein
VLRYLVHDLKVSEDELRWTGHAVRDALKAGSLYVSVMTERMVRLLTDIREGQNARADVARLTAENVRLREAIAGAEWPRVGGYDCRCPWCGVTTMNGPVRHRDWRGGPCPGGGL